MMTCARCDKAIRPGQPYTTHPIDAGSGAAPDVHLHSDCRPDPRVQPTRFPARARH